MSTASDSLFPVDLEERLERQPPLFTAVLLTTVVALLAALFLWMGWARVERTVQAEGRVEPAGRVKMINHPFGGRVATIHVREGERVEAGAPLLTLDGEAQRAAYRETRGRLELARAEVARLEAEAEGREPVFDADLLAERPDLVAAQKALFAARAQALAARREVLEQNLRSRENQVRLRQAEVARLEEGLGLLRKQLEAVRALTERGLYPRLKLVALERQESDARGELEKARAALASARAALSEGRGELEALDRNRHRDVLAELERARAERDRLREELEGQESRLAGLVLRAPIAGIVEDLRITAPGQAIPPNAPVLKIVPVGEELVVEVRVANDDIAEIREGMPATLKVRAFDFLRYGTLPGRVRSISADASRTASDEAPSYRVVVAAERPEEGRSRRMEILPGMLVDVEFRAGERTILSYLTDRILRRGAAAFREG